MVNNAVHQSRGLHAAEPFSNLLNMKYVFLALVLAFVAPLFAQMTIYALSGPQPHWRSADRSASGLAPEPAEEKAAIVQVYAARAYRWRGIFGVHTWLATKEEGASDYTRYDVIGWGRALRRSIGPPDGRWVGNTPQLLFEARGAVAARMIPQIEAAIAAYPYAGNGSYTLWPGPNSNSFIAAIARKVPELTVSLPSLAIGKDYASGWLTVMEMPSNTGWQISIAGYGGIGFGRVEGIELHVLGQTLGIDLFRPAIKLPGIGRLGLERSDRFGLRS
ncbi:DUF3750 domain-containing protein [Hoeflea prorocentri]|uniref:DUF3750 domain-containing protein n=1 Tax=Hoeflea prorocentri TaxID=1922333 RepID=A0A9X3ULC7_9HYPH|nr:DUF3750 domain-containing protein [Hoeflea prorocentri]MCY6382691.1 DUF3750 domain-containing protein [Hoeflea prorocentri]MDA5400491.1 DUF3750 domain-containing protein [Hoeflea prorocentri]